MTFDNTKDCYYGGKLVKKISTSSYKVYDKAQVNQFIPLQWIESGSGQWCYASNTGNQDQFSAPGLDVKFRYLDSPRRKPAVLFGAYGQGEDAQHPNFHFFDVMNDDGYFGGLSWGVQKYIEQDFSSFSTSDDLRILVDVNSSYPRHNIQAPNYFQFFQNDNAVNSQTLASTYVPKTSEDYFYGRMYSLFKLDTSSSEWDVGHMRLYYFKAYNYDSSGNPFLVCDMIPAKDLNGRVGMWDNLNVKMIYSQSGTDFIAGPEAQ